MPGPRFVRGSIAALALAVACGGGPTRHDLYMAGMQKEGEAERGPCKLVFDGAAKAQVLSTTRLRACLRLQDEAIALYEQAAAKGMTGDAAFDKTFARAKQRRENLQSMIANLQRMERIQMEDEIERRLNDPSPP